MSYVCNQVNMMELLTIFSVHNTANTFINKKLHTEKKFMSHGEV